VPVGALIAAVALAAVAAAAPADVHPQIRVGVFPTGMALDPGTGTLYVGNGTANTLSLVDSRRCNSGNTHGCSQKATAVAAGPDPIGLAVDEAGKTLYVVNFSGTVSVVDGRKCNATDASHCRVAAATLQVGLDPQFLAVDQKTHTIYVANSGSNTVSVIDGRKCAQGWSRHCARVRGTVHVGPGPFTVAVNDATHTVYVTDFGGDTISMIDARKCNAADVSGCGRKPVSVNVGEIPGGIAVDTLTNTIYVSGEFSNDVSVIDGRACNGSTATGCRKRPVKVLAGAGARGIAVNEATNTIYVANTAANTVSVIDGSSCNGTVQTGCSQAAAAVPVGVSPRRVVVDPATNTIYITNAFSNSITMLDGRTCDGKVRSGCGRPGTTA